MPDETSPRSPSVALLTPIGRERESHSPCSKATWPTYWKYFILCFERCRRPLSDQPIDKILFGQWGAEFDQTEEVVVCRVSPDALEIHCHGGDAAVSRIISDLHSMLEGTRLARATGGLVRSTGSSSGFLRGAQSEPRHGGLRKSCTNNPPDY